MTLVINGVGFGYPGSSPVLTAASVTVCSGESVAVFGPNGAGKTTFLKLCRGLLLPTAGSVTIRGRNTRDFPCEALAGDIGILFQDPAMQLFAPSVRKEIEFGPRNLGFSEKETDHRVALALELTRLKEVHGHNPHDLPDARRKMVALASVLAMNPVFVLLDEPTLGQDHAGEQTVREVLAWLRANGKAVLCVTHDVDFASEIFGRALVIQDGGIRYDGPIRDLVPRMGREDLSWLPEPQATTLGRALDPGSTVVGRDDLFALIDRHADRQDAGAALARQAQGPVNETPGND